MADLKPLFEKRDKQFLKETLEIFELIRTTLGCVTSYLSDIDEGVSQGMITWEETSLVDDMIVVIGMVDFDIGDTVSIGTMSYTITEENVEEFQRIVHMSVPLDLVEEGNEESILEYLYSLGDNSNIDVYSDIMTPREEAMESDFDLSELTEEQIRALKLSTPKGGH